MKNMALSVLKIKQSMDIRRQQAGVWAALVVLLASSLAPAQTSSVSQQSRQPSPTKEAANTGGASAAAPSTGFVDTTISCFFRTGNRDCVEFQGPFGKVSEGARLNYKDGDAQPVSPGGTLFIRGGTYIEPILLNKKMEIRANDGTARIIGLLSLREFDLVADTVDDNGLPLNPKWGAQRNNPGALPDPLHCPSGRSGLEHDPGSSSCTNQFTYLNGGRFSACGPHVNWFGATYEGIVFWDSHDSEDDDYNLCFRTRNNAGYTTAHDRPRCDFDHIKCEFDAAETIDHFNTPWWSMFKTAVDESDDRARQMINGRFAIMTGLVSLDCHHDCWSELHPVWALAMNVQPSINDDLWAFFVHNWGNGGNCIFDLDQEFIDFPNNTYTFRLPWKDGATDVTFTSQTWHPYQTQNPPPSVRKVPGVGVFVTFTLDAPRDDGSMWDGELHLKWSGPN